MREKYPRAGGWYYSLKKDFLKLSPQAVRHLNCPSSMALTDLYRIFPEQAKERIIGHVNNALAKRSSLDILIPLPSQENPSIKAFRMAGKFTSSETLAGYFSTLPISQESKKEESYESWQEAYIQMRGETLLIIDSQHRAKILQKGMNTLLKQDSLFPDRLEALVEKEIYSNIIEKDKSHSQDKTFAYTVKTRSAKGNQRLYRLQHMRLNDDQQLLSMEDISPYWIARESNRYRKNLDWMNQLNTGLAHRFNNNLMGISGTLELWKDRLSDSQDWNYLEKIQHFTENSQNLIKRFSGYSGREEYTWKILDLEKLVLSVLSDYQNYPLQPLHMNLRVNSQDCRIMGDKEQIEAAFRELIENGLQAITPNGGILEVTIGDVHLDGKSNGMILQGCSPGKYRYVEVQDNGKGIPQNQLKRVFEPFYSTHSQEEGRGMGLSMVLGTLFAHKGTIKVKSKVGEGSLFRLYFPEKMDKPSSKKPSEGILSTSKEHPCLLLVDDEWILLEILEEMLVKQGYEVICKSSSKEALEFYRQQHRKIDLAVLDMVMPELNGKELYQEMKKINPKVKALMLSGFIYQDEREELGEMGFQAILKKPIDRDSLLSIIEENIPNQNDESTLPWKEIELAKQRLGNEKELYVRLIHRFEQFYPKALKELEDCIHDQEMPKAYTRAHQLKNQFNLIGFFELGKKMEKLEIKLSEENPNLSQIQHFYGELGEELKDIPEKIHLLQQKMPQEEFLPSEASREERNLRNAIETHNLNQCRIILKEWMTHPKEKTRSSGEELMILLDDLKFEEMLEKLKTLNHN